MILVIVDATVDTAHEMICITISRVTNCVDRINDNPVYRAEFVKMYDSLDKL